MRCTLGSVSLMAWSTEATFLTSILLLSVRIHDASIRMRVELGLPRSPRSMCRLWSPCHLPQWSRVPSLGRVMAPCAGRAACTTSTYTDQARLWPCHLPARSIVTIRRRYPPWHRRGRRIRRGYGWTLYRPGCEGSETSRSVQGDRHRRYQHGAILLGCSCLLKSYYPVSVKNSISVFLLTIRLSSLRSSLSEKSKFASVTRAPCKGHLSGV